MAAMLLFAVCYCIGVHAMTIGCVRFVAGCKRDMARVVDRSFHARYFRAQNTPFCRLMKDEDEHSAASRT